MSHTAGLGGRVYKCARKWTAKHAGERASAYKTGVMGEDANIECLSGSN